ncbi:hypothetical protein OGG_03557 [Enterococcus faecium EnGen0013]|nr:hypothetical protein OGG_03557 [Enterococcus faecium EnGen0013]EOF93731.1 hypothetical protein SKG_01148 [Enterococcus faecium EnGen0166]
MTTKSASLSAVFPSVQILLPMKSSLNPFLETSSLYIFILFH